MVRATASFLLVGGVALLITWGVRPAESQASRTVPAVAIDATPIPPEIHEINLAVDRLSEQLARRPEATPSVRDPFTFAAVSRPTRPSPSPIETPAAEPVMPRPEWPALVAIMAAANGSELEVALTDPAGDLHVVGRGASVGPVVVSDVSADTVVLTDTVSGQTARLSIR